MCDELLLCDEELEELGLNGLKIIQSRSLYRFTSDAIELTKFASAKKNEVLADFCSGSGIVAMHFYALNKSIVKAAHLFELQPALADMSRRSVLLNGLEGFFSVHNTPVQEIGAEFNGSFSLILCNPPYKRAGSGDANLTESERIARHEVSVTLEEIVSVAARKLKYGGRLCMVHRADRMADVICTMRKYGLEPKRLQLRGVAGKTPHAVLIEGVKGGNPGLAVLPLLEG